MFLLRLLILLFLSLNIFANDEYLDSLTLTKIKKLVEKEEEIATAYKKYISEKGTNKLNNNFTNLRYVSQQVNMMNQDRYRSDILITDKKERRKIISRDSDRRTGRCKGLIRERGTGQILETANGNWRLIITKNNWRCYDN